MDGTRVMAWLPAELRGKIEFEAHTESRTLSNMMRVLLEEALKAREAREEVDESKFWEDQYSE